jgi:hypothetical protein
MFSCDMLVVMQLLPFACGPAALIAYMRDQRLRIPNRIEEQIEIWRGAMQY